MTYTDWEIHGTLISSCNCAWGCPCQFNSLPTYGDCQALLGIEIEKGHFGDIKLDDLIFGFAVRWPGAVHEGDGEFIPVLDERASDEQRAALLKIVKGEESEPGATLFSVYGSTCSKVHDPVFAAIDYGCDVDGRVAHMSVPGMIDSKIGPITNATTGETQEVKILMLGGFEFREAQVASGTTKIMGVLEMEWELSHSHLANFHIGPHGPLN